MGCSSQRTDHGEIENILKTAEFILFFLKKIALSPAKFQKSAEKVGIKVGKPPKKRLDNTVKPCSKLVGETANFRRYNKEKRL